MKKLSVCFCALVLLSAVVLTGCGDKKLSAKDYASELITAYDDYCNEFDSISEALTKGQNVTAGKLCDEASELLDDMIALEAPKKLSEDHKNITKICESEKEKLSLQKELLDIISEGTENLTDKQETRIQEITDRLSVLSLESDKFEIQVKKVADKYLEKQESEPVNLLDQPAE